VVEFDDDGQDVGEDDGDNDNGGDFNDEQDFKGVLDIWSH